MAVQLNIVVGDIAATLSAGYTHIKVYRSALEDSGFVEITTTTSIIELLAGQSDYTFVDGTATTEHWYRTTFYDNNGVVAESAQSSSFLGYWFDTNFDPITYPSEFKILSTDYYKVERVRTLIGDEKELNRDYVSESTGYSSISVDGFTHTFSNPKSWPLRITLDGTEYTTLTEPRVNDYQFLTFSGSQINTTSGTLDVWYYNFRYSDSEILTIFNSLNPHPKLDADQVPFELAAICAAIEILEGELRAFSVSAGTEVDIFQEIRINPKGGIDSRKNDLEGLYKRKEALLAAVLEELEDGINADICGVLID